MYWIEKHVIHLRFNLNYVEMHFNLHISAQNGSIDEIAKEQVFRSIRDNYNSIF